jgi:hypothetical protein
MILISIYHFSITHTADYKKIISEQARLIEMSLSHQGAVADGASSNRNNR